MTLKTVYGPPPEDEERIEAVELEWVSAVREAEFIENAQPDVLMEKGGSKG